MVEVTRVAVAILQKKDGQFLLASRPPDKPWAGWWEFPGGKIEANETVAQALTRELHEELGIKPIAMHAWKEQLFDYPARHDSPAKKVQLYFYLVHEWQGDITAREGQMLSWQAADNLNVSPILPANIPLIRALAVPAIYAISHAAAMGEALFLQALAQQLSMGLRLIELREKTLSEANLLQLAEKVMTLTQAFKAKVLLNGSIALAQKIGADGVHLTSRELMQLTVKPANMLVAASCHQPDELMQAERLALDFVVLSPVKPTKSHPGAPPLGWQVFSDWVSGMTVPVYALGGMSLADLPQAWAAGARGIAMQRAIWGAQD